jgi:diguanylate cyclase (GGDEF)-like protein
MNIDTLTLMVAGGFVSGIACLLLLVAWLQFRSAPAIPWWAAASALNALAVTALAPGYDRQQPVLVALGAGLIPLGAAAIWAGTRAFGGRSVPWWTFPAVATIWLASGLLPVPGGPPNAWVLATLTVSTLLFIAACVELWLGRAENLPTQWPLIIVIGVHAAVCGLGVADAARGLVTLDAIPSLSTGFGLIYFELIIFLLASGVFIVMVNRERVQAVVTAALTIDSLTSIANRSAFLRHAARQLQRLQECRTPASLIVFDLDHFKEINDRHGHAVGDRVLRSFAETAGAVLRPGDHLGRLGGEEFAAFLPDASAETAVVIADRVRHAFEVATATAVPSTVSAGVAEASPNGSLEAVLDVADRALYRAKTGGRNRVTAGPDPTPRAATVVRPARQSGDARAD